MKFARVVFLVAGIYGLIVLLPQYFLEAKVGLDSPPPITHPEFYYGFIGVGRMGGHMARRLLAAGHSLTVFDTSKEATDDLAKSGAQVASSALEVANATEVAFLSLPTPDVVQKVCSGLTGAKKAKIIADCSTTGPKVARIAQAELAKHGITYVDVPVSGGMKGAKDGTLAVMVSGPKAEIDLVKDVLAVFGKVFVIGEKPGMAQTMKLANNFLSATAMAATSEAVAMGVKAGLDPAVMIDVINAGSGRTTASDGKFPQAILPRTFNYGFATALMLKDVRLCVEQAKSLDVPNSVMSAVLDQWETTNKEFGGDSDFTAIVKMIEQRAGVIVGKKT